MRFQKEAGDTKGFRLLPTIKLHCDITGIGNFSVQRAAVALRRQRQITGCRDSRNFKLPEKTVPTFIIGVSKTYCHVAGKLAFIDVAFLEHGMVTAYTIDMGLT